MNWLQTLLDNSTTPVLTAFLLGLITALSPCPLATNIAAISFIGKDIENHHRIFLNGLLYTLGRVLAYTILGFVLIIILIFHNKPETAVSSKNLIPPFPFKFSNSALKTIQK